MSGPTTELRRLLAGQPFVAAEAYSALTARIVEHVGFPAAYMGGHATGMMHYAIPDSGLLTTTEMVDQAGRVAARVAIPVIVDADQAGESVANVVRTVRAFEAAGVAGVHIEDEINPKHSAYDGPLLAVEDMQARLAAAAEARADPDFVIIARCDELYAEGGGGSGSLPETIRRGVAYAEAGADVFLPTFAPPEALSAIGAQVPLPLAGYGPLAPGLALSLFTGWGTASAARAHLELARHLFAHGDVPPEAYGFPDKDELIDQGRYDDVIRTWARRTGRPVVGEGGAGG
jgi:2-methylisocitrate lyase-like PEP mutase family enzyme